jgi:hypothetical protein
VSCGTAGPWDDSSGLLAMSKATKLNNSKPCGGDEQASVLGNASVEGLSSTGASCCGSDFSRGDAGGERIPPAGGTWVEVDE